MREGKWHPLCFIYSPGARSHPRYLWCKLGPRIWAMPRGNFIVRVGSSLSFTLLLIVSAALKGSHPASYVCVYLTKPATEAVCTSRMPVSWTRWDAAYECTFAKCAPQAAWFTVSSLASIQDTKSLPRQVSVDLSLPNFSLQVSKLRWADIN